MQYTPKLRRRDINSPKNLETDDVEKHAGVAEQFRLRCRQKFPARRFFWSSEITDAGKDQKYDLRQKIGKPQAANGVGIKSGDFVDARPVVLESLRRVTEDTILNKINPSTL